MAGLTGKAMSRGWKPKTSWRAKLEQHHPNHGKIVVAPPRMAQGREDASMLIPLPRKVDALVREVPERSVALVSDMRARLARGAGAEIACPLTSGIFLKIVAETSEEDRAGGEAQPAPYWRMLKDGGGLNPKFPGGTAQQADRLAGEGHSIAKNRKGEPARVEGWEARQFLFD